MKKSFLYFFLGQGFWQGFMAPLSGLKLSFKNPKIFSYVLIPLLLNFILYVFFFYYGNQYLTDFSSNQYQKLIHWIGSVFPRFPEFLFQILHFLFKALSWFVLALVAALSFTVVSSLVSAPFNDKLCHAALHFLAREKGISLSIEPSSLSKTLKLEAKRFCILILGSIFLLLLSLIPFFQIPALVLGCFLVSFEYLGFPFSIQTTRLLPIFFFILKNPLISTGFGAFLLLMMALPFTSIFYIPMAVLGGAEIYFNAVILEPSKRKRI